jgi:hypothetical protein
MLFVRDKTTIGKFAIDGVMKHARGVGDNVMNGRHTANTDLWADVSFPSSEPMRAILKEVASTGWGVDTMPRSRLVATQIATLARVAPLCRDGPCSSRWVCCGFAPASNMEGHMTSQKERVPVMLLKNVFSEEAVGTLGPGLVC